MHHQLKSKYFIIIGLLGLLLGIAWLLLRPNSLRQAADQAFQQGQWRQALRDYRTLYQQDQQLDAGFKVLQIYALRGEWQTLDTEAIQFLKQALTPEVRDQTLMLLGWSALQRGDASNALVWWRSVSANNTNQIKLLRTQIALAQGDVLSATNLLNESATLQGEWRNLWLLRAASLSVSDAPSTTLDLLNQIQLSTTPLALPPLDPQQATQQIARLRTIAHQPTDARLIDTARFWRDQGFANTAILILQQIPATSEFDSLAHNELAQIRWAQGDAVTALQDLAETIERYPNVAALRRTQATIAASTGNIALATNALDAAVIMEGKTPENYAIAAAINVAQGDFDSASAAYDAAIQTGILTGTWSLQAANYYLNTPLRPCTSGLAYASNALNSEVDATARRVITQVALRCNNLPIAVAVFVPLAEQTPINDDAELLYLRGAILWQMGWPNFARPNLERAANLAPNSQWQREAERYIGKP